MRIHESIVLVGCALALAGCRYTFTDLANEFPRKTADADAGPMDGGTHGGWSFDELEPASFGSQSVVLDIAVTAQNGGPIVAVAVDERVEFLGTPNRDPVQTTGPATEVAIRWTSDRKLLCSIAVDSNENQLWLGDVDQEIVPITTGDPAAEFAGLVITGDGQRFGDTTDETIAQHVYVEYASDGEYFGAFEAGSASPDGQIRVPWPLQTAIAPADEIIATGSDGRWFMASSEHTVVQRHFPLWDAVQIAVNRSDDEDVRAAGITHFAGPVTQIMRLCRVSSDGWVALRYPAVNENDQTLSPFFLEETGSPPALKTGDGFGPQRKLPGLTDMECVSSGGRLYIVWTDGTSIRLLYLEGSDSDATYSDPIVVHQSEVEGGIQDVELAADDEALVAAWHEVDGDGEDSVTGVTIAVDESAD